MEFLTIGRLARRAGVGVETIRFYERKGLLPETERRPSGYRQYTEKAVRRVRFIRRAKELGFTLKEILELLELRVDPRTTCADLKGRALEKIADIDNKLQALQEVRAALARLAQTCPGAGSTSECPILDSLDSLEDGEVS